ncbi:hypothetical protein NDU88_004163 [Pleurodeles waltl]|uniref:Uncharacterized protein n=1 Tax=Pleurodeles waltl TaxID=8319 RepID=A0AAV7KYM7_PLEWA|nr:hypothetical protein NDU88_004163 [Pleurodeles waltl]
MRAGTPATRDSRAAPPARAARTARASPEVPRQQCVRLALHTPQQVRRREPPGTDVRFVRSQQSFRERCTFLSPQQNHY